MTGVFVVYFNEHHPYFPFIKFKYFHEIRQKFYSLDIFFKNKHFEAELFYPDLWFYTSACYYPLLSTWWQTFLFYSSLSPVE